MTHEPDIATSSAQTGTEGSGSGSPAHDVEAPTRGRARKRRRPSGEAPPLPKRLERTGRYWLGLAVAVLAAWVIVQVVQDAGEEATRVDLELMQPK